MKARGKEIFIIAGVVVVVLCVAWYFLLFSPVNSKLSTLDSQIQAKTSEQQVAQTRLATLESYKKTAPQKEGDLVIYSKMFPTSANVPTIIVELQKAAKDSGVDFSQFQPAGPIAVGSAPFQVQSFTVQVIGRYYDLEDYLYAVQSFVQHRNQTFVVSGRLLAVTSIGLAPGTGASVASGATVDLSDPSLSMQLTLKAYLWATPPVTAKAAGG
jgi:Tfp pilus assembly protein PilO